MYLNEKPNYWIVIFTFLVVNTFSHVKLTRAKGTNPRAKHIGQRIRCSSELEALFSVCCVFRPQICGSDEMKRPTMMTAQQIPRPDETPDQQIQWKDVNESDYKKTCIDLKVKKWWHVCKLWKLHNFAAIYASYISLSTCKITKSKGNMQITVRTLLKINIRKE